MTFREFRNLAVNLACGFSLLYLLHLGTSKGLPQFNQALADVQSRAELKPQFQIQYPSHR